MEKKKEHFINKLDYNDERYDIICIVCVFMPYANFILYNTHSKRSFLKVIVKFYNFQYRQYCIKLWRIHLNATYKFMNFKHSILYYTVQNFVRKSFKVHFVS